MVKIESILPGLRTCEVARGSVTTARDVEVRSKAKNIAEVPRIDRGRGDRILRPGAAIKQKIKDPPRRRGMINPFGAAGRRCPAGRPSASSSPPSFAWADGALYILDEPPRLHFADLRRGGGGGAEKRVLEVLNGWWIRAKHRGDPRANMDVSRTADWIVESSGPRGQRRGRGRRRYPEEVARQASKSYTGRFKKVFNEAKRWMLHDRGPGRSPAMLGKLVAGGQWTWHGQLLQRPHEGTRRRSSPFAKARQSGGPSHHHIQELQGPRSGWQNFRAEGAMLWRASLSADGPSRCWAGRARLARTIRKLFRRVKPGTRIWRTTGRSSSSSRARGEHARRTCRVTRLVVSDTRR